MYIKLANQPPMESFVYPLGRFSKDGLGRQVVSPTFYGLGLCRFLIRKLGHFFPSLSKLLILITSAYVY